MPVFLPPKCLALSGVCWGWEQRASGPNTLFTDYIYASFCHQYQLGTIEELRSYTLSTLYSVLREHVEMVSYFAPHRKTVIRLCIVPLCTVAGGQIWELIVSYIYTKDVWKINSNSKIYVICASALTYRAPQHSLGCQQVRSITDFNKLHLSLYFVG